MVIEPPPRPRQWQDLKFKPAAPTKWFAPKVLADAGLRVAISSAFGAFLDKRELQKSATTPQQFQIDGTGDLWFDFVADTGDGFNPTYTVAWLAAQAELQLSNHEPPLPRARLVVLGGDEVYPVGNPDAYENKFWRPYEAALPWLASDNPHLFAVPGNHDWYDGLTSFFRIFCQGNWIGGRRTSQTRSYFAIQLPCRWWIWGIDIQLDSYVDAPQQEYFEAVDLREDDKVILCTATPSWYDGPESQGSKNLAFVERTLVKPRGARLVLSLSGDSHHYAHYEGEGGTHRITSGGGGAFLHPTHQLSEELPLSLPPSTAASDQGERVRRTACYPSQGTSRLGAVGAVGLLARNPTFVILPAVVYLLLGWSSQYSLRAFGQQDSIRTTAPTFGGQDLLVGLFRNPVSVVLLAVVGLGLFGFAKPPETVKTNWQRMLVRALMALLHLALHVAAIVGASLLAAEVASWWWDGGWQFTLRLVLAMGVVGGVLGGLATGLYLAVCCAGLKAHSNEAYSAMRISGFKNFLRLHLDAEGVLVVYPIGVRKANAKWRLDPDNEPDASWIAPCSDGDRPVAHLIEEPFVIDPSP